VWRTTIPTTTSTTLSRNGTRQPRCQEKSDRNTDLREGTGAAAAIARRRLDRHEHGAAPLTTGRQALQDTEQNEDDGSRDADLLVGRQQTDEGRRHTHQNQGDDEHRLATEPVTEVAGEERSERAEEEADSHRTEREQDGDLCACRLEEELCEYEPGRARVEEEVVPLDGGSDDCSESDLASFRRRSRVDLPR
jgi:hypothetical protein